MISQDKEKGSSLACTKSIPVFSVGFVECSMSALSSNMVEENQQIEEITVQRHKNRPVTNCLCV